TSDGAKIIIGRSTFLEECGVEISSSSIFPLVSMNGSVVGQILVKSIYNENSRRFLTKLFNLVPCAKVKILSGDSAPNAGFRFKELHQNVSYVGNLSPEAKAEEIQASSMFVGDGLNDTLALAKARVSFRLGHRILGF